MEIHGNVSEKAKWAVRERSGEADTMLRRVNLLTGHERAMMTLYFEKGTSFRQIAKLAGVDERTVSRRIHAISSRLMDGRYGRCLRNREMFTNHELAIAKEHFVRGKSIRALTKEKRTTYHKMRATVNRIERVLELLKDKKHNRR